VIFAMLHKDMTHRFLHFPVHSLDARLQHLNNSDQMIGILDKVRRERNKVKAANNPCNQLRRLFGYSDSVNKSSNHPLFCAYCKMPNSCSELVKSCSVYRKTGMDTARFSPASRCRDSQLR
jgi:hypothetical protein